jgi:hypothetical protein
MKVNCEFCGTELDPQRKGCMKYVQCWVEPGKASGIKLVTDAAGWAHRICVETEDKKRKGWTNQKEVLF